MSLRPVKEFIHTSQPSKVPASLRNAFGFGKETGKPRGDSASQQGESHEQEY